MSGQCIISNVSQRHTDARGRARAPHVDSVGMEKRLADHCVDRSCSYPVGSGGKYPALAVWAQQVWCRMPFGGFPVLALCARLTRRSGQVLPLEKSESHRFARLFCLCGAPRLCCGSLLPPPAPSPGQVTLLRVRVTVCLGIGKVGKTAGVRVIDESSISWTFQLCVRV